MRVRESVVGKTTRQQLQAGNFVIFVSSKPVLPQREAPAKLRLDL
jgi:hypothetical protein